MSDANKKSFIPGKYKCKVKIFLYRNIRPPNFDCGLFAYNKRVETKVVHR